ncbi:PREDICTED: 5-formyltetrahydrofolate cyclo-ligase, mitochondrial-like [Prunus mume]|uniref:5-formyltetrahydrofolate cyclo-ligase n=1 Tax=Prunus mume TaxID=102107 RepID=A0ABM0PHF9_PRUMU|nr:PREDICTED: 5-formyltetrahydrofolate cyclo-ligase, mitochondrial-like [Prunus mume]
MAGRLVVALMAQSCTLATPPSAVAAISLKLSRAAILRPPPSYAPTSLSTRTITMNINSQEQQQDNLDGIFKQKRILRSKVRKALKAMDPTLRSHEDNAIQSIVLEAPWFRSSQRLCAYICCSALREVDTSNVLSAILQSPLKEGDVQVRKKLYVPRVEDKNCHMRMLNISCIDDLVANSMNILEPAPIDADGNEREDVLQASDPVDLFLLPGLAFDRSGRRLGRGGGYYDTFLKNYQELAKTRNWKQPLLVALSYSVQILDEGVPVTPHDILVDALVSPAGVIPISPAALDRMRP